MASFSDSDLLDLDGSDTAVMHSTLSDSSPITPMESHPEIVFYLSFRLLIAFFLVGLFLFLLRRMIDRKRTVNLSLSFHQ